MLFRFLVALLAAAVAATGLPAGQTVAEAAPIASDDRIIEVTPILPHRIREVAVSRDGRYVAYGTAQGLAEVYLYDIETGETTHVSRNILLNTGSISFSPDSSRLIFSDLLLDLSLLANQSRVYSYEIATGITTDLTELFDTSPWWAQVRIISARVAADNRTVVAEIIFVIPGAPRWYYDILLFDAVSGEADNITRQSDGISRSPEISDDGSVVSFVSSSSDLTPEPKVNFEFGEQPFLYFPATDTYRSVTPETTGEVNRAFLSPKGDELVFSSDDKTLDPRVEPAGQYGDQYTYDIPTGETTRITYNSDLGGAVFRPSATGRWLPIVSSGNVNDPTTGLNIIDRKTGEEINLSYYLGEDDRWRSFVDAVVSKNGRTVVMQSHNSVTVYQRPRCMGRYATHDLVLPRRTDLPLATNGDDRIAGTDGDDIIDAGGGNDIICGYAGNDQLHGGSGHDILNGKAGKDKLWGGPGNDILNGNVGTDKLFGDQGKDILRGSKGPDLLNGGIGNDTCRGGAGTDTLINC